MSRRQRLAIGTATGLLVILVGGGVLLPSEAVHSVTVEADAPPELIFELINSPGGWASWAGSPEMPSPGAHDSGVGALVTWQLQDGSFEVLEITESHAYSGISYRAVGDHPRLGNITIEPSPDGSRITWQDRRRLAWGPLHRWSAYFEGPPMAGCLSDLVEVATVWRRDMKPPPIDSVMVPITPTPTTTGSGAVYEGQ